MKLRNSAAAILLGVAACAATAYGENDNACTGLEATLVQPKGDLPPRVLERIRTMARSMEAQAVPMGLACADLGKVFGRLVHGTRQAGKKLEGDKPLDVAAAQAELDQALQQDPELKAQLEAVRSAAIDEQERLLYEAALLQSNNLYGARDLRLQQFIKQAKGE
jgi:hypothetical protein